ncbi:hypothetical protein Vafri_9896 [Volvox africanus]|uniref:Uncharacterized protein n=1 Tax=Volvox africanus TaxID=51714 RepID=A0A8J4B581_9CHLO|nr:hypothetical protein Vafri_9896 [Volvox africanus]
MVKVRLRKLPVTAPAPPSAASMPAAAAAVAVLFTATTLSWSSGARGAVELHSYMRLGLVWQPLKYNVMQVVVFVVIFVIIHVKLAQLAAPVAMAASARTDIKCSVITSTGARRGAMVAACCVAATARTSGSAVEAVGAGDVGAGGGAIESPTRAERRSVRAAIRLGFCVGGGEVRGIGNASASTLRVALKGRPCNGI